MHNLTAEITLAFWVCTVPFNEAFPNSKSICLLSWLFPPHSKDVCRTGKDLQFSKLVFGKFPCQVTLCQELIIFLVDTGDFTLNHFEGSLMQFQTMRFVCMNHSNLCSFYIQSSASFPDPSPRCFSQNHHRFSTAHFTEWFCDKMGRGEIQDFWFFSLPLSLPGYVVPILSVPNLHHNQDWLRDKFIQFCLCLHFKGAALIDSETYASWTM